MTRQDNIATLSNSLRARATLFYSKICTLQMYIWTKMIGIQLGKHSAFYGPPIFRREPNSKFTIGNNNRFDSMRSKNPIGLIRPCIFTVFENATLSIGDQNGFSGTVIRVLESVEIGNGVKIGANCTISDHEGHPEDPRSTPPRHIIIGDDVWLGMNVVVLKGVTIGRGSLIGANSVVTQNIPPYSVAVGSPARVVRSLPIISE